jgi:ribosomal-protein-alanine N-acetyltransferase
MVGDDLDRIMAVMSVAFDPAWGEAWTRAQVEGALLMGNCDYLLIAGDGLPPTDDSPAAGFALLRTVLDEQELLLFAIVPEWRNRGLGTRLLQQVKMAAKVRRMTRILLEMRQGNSAESLYRAQGFAYLGVRPNYYRRKDGERLAAVTFSCTLD